MRCVAKRICHEVSLVSLLICGQVLASGLPFEFTGCRRRSGARRVRPQIHVAADCLVIGRRAVAKVLPCFLLDR